MEKLKKQRRQIKARLTRINTFVDTYESDTNKDLNEFVIREDLLVKAFEEYQTVQDSVEEKDESEADDRDSFEESYCSILARVKSIIKNRTKEEVIPPLNSSSISQHPSLDSSTVRSQVKLPNLNIPVFHGEYGEWKSFFDIFTALIDSDTKLSNVQKFLYLKTALKGEPINLVDDLTVTNENYEIALQILKNRYDNKLSIINSHIKSILDIPNIGKVSCSLLRDFLTTIKKHINALKSLNVPVESWDIMLVYVLSHKLDFGTHRAYELEKESGSELPTLKELLDFIDKRCLALERVSPASDKQKYSKVSHFSSNKNYENSNSQRNECAFCKLTNHGIYKCFKFSKLAVSERRKFVVDNGLCFNCLGSKHLIAQCKAKTCARCGAKHSSLLHVEMQKTQYQPVGSENLLTDKQDNEQRAASVTCVGNSCETSLQASVVKTVLLSTAKVVLISDKGNKLICKALLDSGSMTSFVTSKILKQLNTTAVESNINISGLGDRKLSANKQVTLLLKSLVVKDFSLKADFTVLDKITCKLPQTKLDKSRLTLDNVQLGDPEFYIPSEIDILIGSDIFYEIIQPGLIKLGHNLPTMQNTSFGWVLYGPVVDSTTSNLAVSLFSQSEPISINDSIPKFWQLEEIQGQKSLSPEDKLSEDIFNQTTTRLGDGRFQVNLPIKNNNELLKLGDSYELALGRFISLEKKLIKNEKVYREYKNFINEYVELNQARYVPLDLSDKINRKNFFPHFCVIREQAESTKLRVVFDSSMKTTTQVSLNDVLLKGYTVQPDLFDILCRFRCFLYVVIADIQKMFRQIKINPSQTYLQNILWRDSPEELIRCIELSTVTYGTNCAPFLATRCLVQLAQENNIQYPLASQAVLEQCYVDDILGGSNTHKGIVQLQKELSLLLDLGCFKLHKWHSNNDLMLGKTLNSGSENSEISLSESSKVLGLSWSESKDSFKISLCQPECHEKVTKRVVLSNISRMYDPLGLIGPIIVLGKIFMQKVWTSKINWDDPLGPELLKIWNQFCSSLNKVTELEIPRCLISQTNPIEEIELVGFSDASLVAYGACAYLRVKYCNNEISSHLICSKSRVAPLKVVSLPRLELCGFLLLTRLIHKLEKIFTIKISKTYLFTDSEIVLHWIRGIPSQWTIFVANRVAEIQELSVNSICCHIPSKQNPADYISRGTEPKELLNCSLWWKGPAFLEDSEFEMPNGIEIKNNIEKIPEQRKTVCNVSIVSSSLFSRFSKFNTLLRSVAYCLRFINNCSSKKEKIIDSCLSVDEIQKSLQVIIKCIQAEFFGKELKCFEQGKPIIKDSQIISLNPFIDQKGILRVGGRILNATVNYEQKHPIILPNNCHVVSLIVKHEHDRLGHGGVHTVLSNLRLKYWPIGGPKLVKKVINACVTCHRFKANFSEQLMGSLPPERVACVRPFHNVGVDFAGPIAVKESKLRKARVSKAYISLFVCMNTKAIHIELVSDLSTENFLLCLKRFTSRRGVPFKIFSDNATNFQGANNNLRELYLFFKSKEADEIRNYLASRECQWQFIPPNSPHWGGLWEAGVKSMKYHLKRIIGKSVLTFEQLTTVLCQIESILNSRPLIPSSNRIDDYTYLSPSHFLIGESFSSLPEKDLSKVPDTRLSDYNLVTKMRQHFWQRWVLEYLNKLQNRPKWVMSQPNLKPGMLVILKEDNAPPLQWSLARIESVILGSDGKVRVVTLRTPKGTFTRPITKVSPLPFELVEG